MKKILGLDVSTHFGWCSLDNTLQPKLGTYTSKSEGFDRLLDYEEFVEELIDCYDPDVAIIEGYGFGPKSSIAILVSIGTLARRALFSARVPWIEVPPTSLKKFATGKGNCKKNLVLLQCYKRWGIELVDDNQADALALAMAGADLAGHVTVPKAQSAVLDRYRDTFSELFKGS